MGKLGLNDAFNSSVDECLFGDSKKKSIFTCILPLHMSFSCGE